MEDEGLIRDGETYGHGYRDTGFGPFRIDEPIEGGFRVDLYSMIFVTCLRPAYVLHYKQEIEEKEKLIEKARAEHR